MSSAAILLFGKDPQQFFPRARVRFVRYDGIEARVGTEMNVIKDVIFTDNNLWTLSEHKSKNVSLEKECLSYIFMIGILFLFLYGIISFL